jgi:hypothetical protein
MPDGKGTYGTQVGRPPKKPKKPKGTKGGFGNKVQSPYPTPAAAKKMIKETY